MLRDWTTSEKIDQLSETAEIFFVRLIMKADDHGCFHAHPKLLKAALFPLKNYSETVIEGCLNELSLQKIIVVYESDGRKYLKINDFGQRLRNMVSKFPQPADNMLTIVSKQPPELEYEENKNTNTNVAVAQDLKLPFDTESFLNAWNKWISYKKERNQKFSKTTKEMQLRKLGARPEHEAIAMLNQSMENGWTGLFNLKSQTNGKGKKTHTDNARELAIDFINRRGTPPQG